MKVLTVKIREEIISYLDNLYTAIKSLSPGITKSRLFEELILAGKPAIEEKYLEKPIITEDCKTDKKAS